MLEFILILVAALPIAWLCSEFQPHRMIRVVLGATSILMAFGVAWGVSPLVDRFNSNIWYGAASKDLVENTILALEAGDTDKVIAELRALSATFEPTYENRAEYDELVSNYVHAITDSPIHHSESRFDDADE